MDDLTISSPANPRLKSLLGLRRRRARHETGSTLIEGYEELMLAVRARVLPQVVYYCPELFSPSGTAGAQAIGTQADLLSELRSQRVELVRLTRLAFEKVAYREGPDGLIGVVAAPGMSCAELPLSADPLLLIAQGVEKPGNLGAMLRTADATGASAVVAADPVTDWGNPNVVRASKGTVFALPVASATTAETIAWSRSHGIRLVVTTPDTDVVHTDADLTGAVAIVVGSEKHGVDDELMAAADVRIRIPMSGRVNSLNVSVAAAVVLYEAIRQRSSTTT